MTNKTVDAIYINIIIELFLYKLLSVVLHGVNKTMPYIDVGSVCENAYIYYCS